jgi:hypothetical protein
MKEMLVWYRRGVALEDPLIDNGWDEISVRTEHGMFIWMTDKRAAEIEEEGDEPESPGC